MPTCVASRLPSAAKIDGDIMRLYADLPKARRELVIGTLPFVLTTLVDLDQVLSRWLKISRAGPVKAHRAREQSPHGGVLWPAARALCKHLLEREADWSRSTPILELGCGLALPSLLLRRLGFTAVTASDCHPLVALLLAENAERQAILDLNYQHLDWRQPPNSAVNEAQRLSWPLIIGSDLLYEAWQPLALAQQLAGLLASRGSALIADPGRQHVDAFVGHAHDHGLDVQLAALHQPEDADQSRPAVMILQVTRL